jgi:hypothetical protein
VRAKERVRVRVRGGRERVRDRGGREREKEFIRNYSRTGGPGRRVQAQAEERLQSARAGQRPRPHAMSSFAV